MNALPRLRPFAWALALLLLALACPLVVSSQPLAAGPPQLAPEARARLSQAAGDTLLSPWQREFMLRLARGGAFAAPDPAATGARAEGALRAADANDGTWTELIKGGRSAHTAIYDQAGDRMVVFGGSDGVTALNDVWALSLAGTPTDVQVALVSADATVERVRLEWALGDGAGVSAAVYRCTAGMPWQMLATVSADGTGRIRYEDAAITPGTRYGHRLGLRDGGGEVFAGETWVEVPAAASFALSGVRPNPATAGGLWVRFALPTAEAAALELYDVGGRRVESRDVGALGAGEHELRLDSGTPLAPGVYLLRLTQGARSLTARAVVIR